MHHSPPAPSSPVSSHWPSPSPSYYSLSRSLSLLHFLFLARSHIPHKGITFHWRRRIKASFLPPLPHLTTWSYPPSPVLPRPPPSSLHFTLCLASLIFHYHSFSKWASFTLGQLLRSLLPFMSMQFFLSYLLSVFTQLSWLFTCTFYLKKQLFVGRKFAGSLSSSDLSLALSHFLFFCHVWKFLGFNNSGKI